MKLYSNLDDLQRSSTATIVWKYSRHIEEAAEVPIATNTNGQSIEKKEKPNNPALVCCFYSSIILDIFFMSLFFFACNIRARLHDKK